MLCFVPKGLNSLSYRGKHPKELGIAKLYFDSIQYLDRLHLTTDSKPFVKKTTQL